MKAYLVTFLIFISLSLCGARDFKQPEELEHKASESVKIYPIGWSEDGNFAFIQFSPYPGEPVYYEFIIQSAVTDQILYRKSIYKGRRSSLKGGDDLKIIWDGYYSHFKNMLIQYGIKNQEKYEAGNTGAFSYKNRTYGITVSQTKSNHQAPGKSKEPQKPVIDKASVIISSKTLGKKRVFFYSREKQKTDVMVADSFCAGYIQSPLEDRIVIIYIEDHLESGQKSLRLIGAHLTAGFK